MAGMSIEEFENSTDKNIELFAKGLRQEFQDFINVVELKLMSQDKEIKDAVTFMTTNLNNSVTTLLKEIRENGELTNDVLTAFQDIVDNINTEIANREQSDSLLQTNINSERSERIANEKLINERINTFTALEDGSTSGDAELMDARTDFNGKTHTNVGTHIRTVTSQLYEEIVDVEEMVDNSNTGIEYLKGNFVVGLVSSDGTIDTVDTGYLCSTANKITYDRDVTITVESGYQFFLRFFNQNGTLEKTTGWSTSNHTVPKDSIFMLSIKKYPEDYTDRPVPDEMKKKLTVKTVIETRISVLEKKVDELENPKSSWNGKNWYSFGTSMSDTSFEMPYELGGVTGKYPPYLVSLSGLVHHNYAIGGSRISKSATADRNTAVQQIMNTDISNADIITLDGLVNDFAESTPIGEFGDTTDETIMGALYQFVSYAMEHSEATIVLLTDTSGKVWTTPQGTVHPTQYIPTKKNGVGLYQSDYRKAMMDFAEWFGCICIDCGSKSNINYLHPEYLQDQLHHSEKGGEQFANTIWSELKNIQPNVSVI